MSPIEKIFGIFKPTVVVPQGQIQNIPAQTAPVVAPNNAPQNNLQVPPNVTPTGTQGVVPNDGSATAPANQSPLNQFAKVWEPVSPEQQAQNGPAIVAPDHKKIMEAAAQVDFTKIISQDDLAKISAGGAGAEQAFASALNRVAQETFGRSMAATARIVEQAVSTAETRFQERLPSAVNRVSARDQLLTENPAFNNPAVLPIVEMVQTQLAAKHPNANPAELANLARDYFQQAAGVFNPAKPPVATPGPKVEDWSSYGPTP